MQRFPWTTFSTLSAVAFALAVAPASGQKSTVGPAKPTSGATADSSKPHPALNGYCPTAYLLQGKAVKGDPAFQSTYQDNVYYLSSAEAKRQFDADPTKFLPQFGGLCTTALGGTYGNRFLGEPDVFDIHKRKVYLFSSRRAKRAYLTAPDSFVLRAREVFAKPFLEGDCPVSYLREQTAVPGKETLTYVYREFTIRFASEAKRKAFIADPQKYFPKYDGFCATAVAKERRLYADPSLFVVYNGHTYLFHNGQSRKDFLHDPEAIITKADAVWPAVRVEALTPGSKRRH